MDTILATAETTSDINRMIETLATYVDEYGCDTGGGHQRTMLLTAVIARLFDITPAQAINLARDDYWDPRVREASRVCGEILDRVRRTREAADYDETPAAVTR